MRLSGAANNKVHRAFIGLGANLGHRLQTLCRARDLCTQVGKVAALSRVYESEPWGLKEQPPFLNAVIELHTHLGIRELAQFLWGIEKELGRSKLKKWGPRNIDLDLLLYDGWVYVHKDLVVPHPGIADRKFVLLPLLDLEPEGRLPAGAALAAGTQAAGKETALEKPGLERKGISFKELLERCPDPGAIEAIADSL